MVLCWAGPEAQSVTTTWSDLSLRHLLSIYLLSSDDHQYVLQCPPRVIR